MSGPLFEYTVKTTGRKQEAYWLGDPSWESQGWQQYDFDRDDFTDTYFYRRPAASFETEAQP